LTVVCVGVCLIESLLWLRRAAAAISWLCLFSFLCLFVVVCVFLRCPLTDSTLCSLDESEAQESGVAAQQSAHTSVIAAVRQTEDGQADGQCAAHTTSARSQLKSRCTEQSPPLIHPPFPSLFFPRSCSFSLPCVCATAQFRLAAAVCLRCARLTPSFCRASRPIWPHCRPTLSQSQQAQS